VRWLRGMLRGWYGKASRRSWAARELREVLGLCREALARGDARTLDDARGSVITQPAVEGAQPGFIKVLAPDGTGGTVIADERATASDPRRDPAVAAETLARD